MTAHEKFQITEFLRSPLIFCVFPSLLTVLLGPVVVTLARQFIKVGGA